MGTCVRQMKNILLLFNLLGCLLILNASGCKAQPQKQISGKLGFQPDWKPIVYLIKPRHFQEIAADYLAPVIDSAEIAADGSFVFQTTNLPDKKTLFIVAIQKKGSRYANHLIDDALSTANYMPVIYSPGESFEITADANSFQPTFSIKSASKENLNLLALRDIRKNAFEKYIGLSSEMEDDSLLIQKERAYTDYIGAMMTFADSTAVPEAAMVAIRWISPANDYERIPEFIFGQCQKWSVSNPGNVFINEFCLTAQKDKLPLMTGDYMPDMNLPLVTGDTVTLSSILGKKLTLVDLWASWCAPCRKETREELIPLWNQYRDKGFQIIGYSIDANEDPWKNAIWKDGSTWKHASHLTGDSTPFMDTLRISTIPANYLLDTDGKILAKNLHGYELQSFIQSIYSNSE